MGIDSWVSYVIEEGHTVLFNRVSPKPLAMLRVVACVLMLGSILAFAQAPPDSIETAIKRYRQSGVISNDLIKEQVGKLVNQREDCNKMLEKTAFDLLSPEQKRLLSPSFVDDLPGIREFRLIKRQVDRVNIGFTDVDVARFYWNVNRGAAFRHRTEQCGSAKSSPQNLFSSDAAITGLATAKDVDPASPTESSRSVPSSTSALPGKLVVGIDEWEGEIVGDPVQGSKFLTLKIGMKVSEIRDQLGQPNDQVFSITAKQLIPLNVGSDKYRLGYYYKGIGRLIFSSAQGAAFTEMHLISIVHDSKEMGKVWN